MNVTLRALTICQPHAFFIVAKAAAVQEGLPPKRIENRTWGTAYRGPLLIHAGRSRSWLRDFRQTNLPPLDFGAFIGICDLIDCIPWDRHYSVPDWIADHPHADAIDCFWWQLDNVRRFQKPIPWAGKQGLWTPFTHGRTLHNDPGGRLLRQAIATAEPIGWKPEAV